MRLIELRASPLQSPPLTPSWLFIDDKYKFDTNKLREYFIVSPGNALKEQDEEGVQEDKTDERCSALSPFIVF